MTVGCFGPRGLSTVIALEDRGSILEPYTCNSTAGQGASRKKEGLLPLLPVIICVVEELFEGVDHYGTANLICSYPT